MDFEELVRPENELERSIIANAEWQEGAKEGKPRRGHPEGAVINHIVEVLLNVDKYSPHASKERADLRIITLIHDTFKHKVDRSKDKSGENHHATIARRFAERIGITNKTILEIIELHDEAYNAWCVGDRDDKKWGKAEDRAKRLISRLDDVDVEALNLYLKFYKCDNETGDKKQDNVSWFDDIVLES